MVRASNPYQKYESVRKPDGSLVSFEYDVLGRRISKTTGVKVNRFLWDGNVLLHEWYYQKGDEPETSVNDLGEVFLSKKETVNNLVTWIYQEKTFVPSAKIQGEERYSIISDYIGRPVQAYNENGSLIWQTDYNIYGKLRNLQGDEQFVPFRQLGQYGDPEIELYYNRFRYYDYNIGNYISQDPIGLLGDNPNIYAYVFDSNSQFDPFGLSTNPLSIVDFTDSAGTSLRVNGYTDLSHLSEKELKALYYANTKSGWGLSPKDKQGNTIVLHHYKQNPNGPIVAMPAKHHDKPHTNPGQHPFGKKKGGGLTKAEREAFDNWRKEYHAHLAETELNKRGIKCK